MSKPALPSTSRSSPAHTTNTQTQVQLLFLSLISFSASPSPSFIHYACIHFVPVAQHKAEPQNRCVQLGVFSGAPPRQQSVATVTSYQHFLLH